jgi:hypothetical protein
MSKTPTRIQMINVADGGRLALLLLPRTSVTNHQNGRPSSRSIGRRKRPDAGGLRRNVPVPHVWRPGDRLLQP